MHWFKMVRALMACVLAVGASFTANPAAAASAPQNIYEGLRSMVLNTSAMQLGLKLPDETLTAYGVVMDMGLARGGTATLVAFSTGDASLYVSTGGGVIGAGRHVSVKQSALVLVQTAQAHLASLSSTVKFDGPANGQVRFFVLTNRGVLTATESEDQVNAGGVPLSPLWDAGQQLLSKVRLISDNLEK